MFNISDEITGITEIKEFINQDGYRITALHNQETARRSYIGHGLMSAQLPNGETASFQYDFLICRNPRTLAEAFEEFEEAAQKNSESAKENFQAQIQEAMSPSIEVVGSIDGI